MVTEDDAVKIAEKYVQSLALESGISLKLFRDALEAHDFGWVFFYGSSDPENPVSGNGPIIVDRSNGSIFTTGTAYPLSTYLDNLRNMGDPNSLPGRTAILKRLTDDSRRIDVVLLIRDLGRLSLADAKRYLENCIDGLQPTIDFDSPETATQFVDQSAGLGLIAIRETGMR